MKKIGILLLVFVVPLFCTTAVAQQKSKAEVKNVFFELKNNKLEIIYDLLNNAENETFNISVEILNYKGELIDAKSLSGDIHKNISGGFNKKIVWDLMKDKVVLSDSITVKVTAKLYKPEE